MSDDDSASAQIRSREPYGWVVIYMLLNAVFGALAVYLISSPLESPGALTLAGLSFPLTLAVSFATVKRRARALWELERRFCREHPDISQPEVDRAFWHPDVGVAYSWLGVSRMAWTAVASAGISVGWEGLATGDPGSVWAGAGLFVATLGVGALWMLWLNPDIRVVRRSLARYCESGGQDEQALQTAAEAVMHHYFVAGFDPREP